MSIESMPPVPAFENPVEGYVKLVAVLRFYFEEKAKGEQKDEEATIEEFLLFVCTQSALQSGFFLDEIEEALQKFKAMNQRSKAKYSE